MADLSIILVCSSTGRHRQPADLLPSRPRFPAMNRGESSRKTRQAFRSVASEMKKRRVGQEQGAKVELE